MAKPNPYNNSRWKKARAAYLLANPHCVMCEQDRHHPWAPHVFATVVDHIVPHKDDPHLMWSTSNFQPLCTTHHNATKQREERGGAQWGHDENGFPLSPKHP